MPLRFQRELVYNVFYSTGSAHPSSQAIKDAKDNANLQASSLEATFEHIVALSKQYAKRTGTTPIVKISQDGVDIGKVRQATVFSVAVVGTQRLEHIGVLKIVMKHEDYDSVRESGVYERVYKLIEKAEGEDDTLVFDFVADLKSILLVLGYKSANGDNTCIYCSCDRSQWHLCGSEAHHCVSRIGADFKLTPLNADANGFNRQGAAPLLDVTKFRFVQIDVMHCHFRVTDQLFQKTLNLSTGSGKKYFTQVISDLGLTNYFNFGMVDTTKGYTFTKLTMRVRERLLEEVFVRHHLFNIVSGDALESVVNVFCAFKTFWAHLKCTDNTVNQVLLKDFITQFRTTFVVGRLANYMHLLCHLPELYKQFGNLHKFQQQSVESLNNHVSTKVRTVCQPQEAAKQAMESWNRRFFYYPIEEK